MGARESLNGRKKWREEKKRKGRRARRDNVLPNQFQTVAGVLASDWCQKTFEFSVQSEGSRPRSRFVCFKKRKVREVQLFAMFIWAVRGGFIHEVKRRAPSYYFNCI